LGEIECSLDNRRPRSNSLPPVCQQPILRLGASFFGF